MKRIKNRTFLLLLFLSVSLAASVYLVQQRQDIRKQAAENTFFQTSEAPEYVDGQVIVKFNDETPIIEVSQEKRLQGITMQQNQVTLGDLDVKTIPKSLNEIQLKYGVVSIEKVFKGSENPTQEVQKLQQRFSSEIASGKRQIRDQELVNINLSNTYLITFDKKYKVDQIVNELSYRPDIAYAEPNYIYTTTTIPSDPYFDQLWGLYNTGQNSGIIGADIDATKAWDVTIGNETILIGVIDTGIDHRHPDLASNIWINPNEIVGNSIDDDGNGYIDDVRGWNFINNTPFAIDDQGHGTHVGGTVGVMGNNSLGIAGVAWNVKLVPLKFLNSGYPYMF